MTIPPHSGYVEGWPRRSGMPRSVKTFARGGETLPMILPAASPSAREFGLERICDFPIICRAVGPWTIDCMHSIHADEAGSIPHPESWSGLLTSRVWFALLNMSVDLVVGCLVWRHACCLRRTVQSVRSASCVAGGGAA